MQCVGLRDWEHRAEGKKPKVDLLYVYSESQIPELKKDSKFNTEILPNSVKMEDDSGIIFTNDVDDDEDFIQQEQKMKSSTNENKIMDIDFDDI